MWKQLLNKIRLINKINIKNLIIHWVVMFSIWIFSGFIAKHIEAIPHIGKIWDTLNIIWNIFSWIGIWVFIATIISAWSKDYKSAGIKVFLFFCGVLLSYYIYSMYLFWFFPTYYFIRWWLIAIASLFWWGILWFSRWNWWLAWLLAATPIWILMHHWYDFFNIIVWTDFILWVILLIILPQKKIQIFRIIPFIFIIILFLKKFNILSYFLGGL